MDSVLKRVLTRKSILGFGKSSVRDLSVQMIIDSGLQRELVSAYFGLSKIDFTEDILDELMIPIEMRLNKPSKVYDLKDAIQKWYNHKYSILGEDEKLSDCMSARSQIKHKYKTRGIKDNISFSKSNMQRKNHGH